MTPATEPLDRTLTVIEVLRARITAELIERDRAGRSARARAAWVMRREREAAR